MGDLWGMNGCELYADVKIMNVNKMIAITLQLK